MENLHRYIETEYCIDVFLAQGEDKKILNFLGRVKGTRGVQQVKTIFLPLEAFVTQFGAGSGGDSWAAKS